MVKSSPKGHLNQDDLVMYGEVTEVLLKWSSGNREALDDLLPIVYKELKKIAHYYLQSEAANHPLQTTGLVNEVYLQLVETKKVKFLNRGQFFLFAGKLMRQILVKYARRRLAYKRGGDQNPISFDEVIHLADEHVLEFHELVALDDALGQLEKTEPRQCRVVELKFFAGMTNTEIADILAISFKTVKRDWRAAKDRLLKELGKSQ